MVPRREVFAVDIEDPDEEILDAVLESRHSRIPVYEETVDNIIGILHAKDVMIEMRKKTTGEIEIRGLLRDVFLCRIQKMPTICFENFRHPEGIWRCWWMSMVDSPESLQ